MSLPDPGPWSYAVMLAFCLAATLPLEVVFRLRVLGSPLRLAATLLPVGAGFLLWDLAATRAGHWSFDPDQTLPPRLAGIPLEEVAFFLVVPLAAVLTYEAVGAVAARRARRGARP